MATDGVSLRFTRDAVREIARLACVVNENTENIGARRLHTMMEALLEDVSFRGTELRNKKVRIDAAYVRKRLSGVVEDKDMSRYIL
jgi:ATP-dependent HslUV protease ATP-binding subunit HslU